MIKNIVFDMGGVLIDFSPEKTFMRVFKSEEDVRLLCEVLFKRGLWAKVDIGIMSFAEAAKEACAVLPSRLHERLCGLLENWWDEMPSFEHMYEFIKELKEKGFGVYLCSNTSVEVYNRFDSIPALSLMDGIIASADYGILKPDERLFHKLFEKFSLNPSECYFIDDMQANIEGAKKAGMSGHCYSHGDIEKLKQAMKNDGIPVM